MESLEAFLESLEERLRCTRERRDEVLEELAGHVEDRIEALMSEGYSRLSAERTAIRELGAPQVLAFRLSRANGWSVAGFVLRQLWALGMASGVGLAVLLSLDAMDFGAGLRPAHLLLFAPLAVYGFALGAVVRELYWAVVLTNLVALAIGAGQEDAAPLAPAALFFVAAVAGHWARWPRPAALAWGSGALTVLAACLVPWSPSEYTARDLLFGREAAVGWISFAVLWMPWLLARALGTLGRRASRPWRAT